MERYLCIHCHFYQPPRENPWLEAVEQQDSASPYHDWNERITAECYAPNSAARILSGDGRISEIVNNYSSISFNFGPTLLSWMENRAPETYAAILEADAVSQQRFSGHGNAIAQAYNHIILPLANRRDKETQVLWGVRDFEERFGRAPEGMWLPETAVDVETLEVLADRGLKYTVLAPHQARHVRKSGGTRFRNVEGAKIDPTQAYVCKLPSGRSISLFFYDGPISRAVAFEGLLTNGETFASRLMSGFSDHRKWPQLMHIATDGETYGHHHRHGEMALAYALHHIESKTWRASRITASSWKSSRRRTKSRYRNARRGVAHTAWSAGIAIADAIQAANRSGGKTGAARYAMRWIRCGIPWQKPYEEHAGTLLRDPWIARDAYISVVGGRTEIRLEEFFDGHAAHSLSEDEKVRALKLLEMQRHAMLMYTSCGWFFDELSGIETVQVIMYAGRALQLAVEIFGGEHLEETFLEQLKQASSNLSEFGNGADIYRRWVKPAAVDLLKVAAHYAISSLFDRYAEHSAIYCYDVELLEQHRQESGRAHLSLGRAHVSSEVTRETMEVSFGVLHFGDHNVNAGVRVFRNAEEFQNINERSLAGVHGCRSAGSDPRTRSTFCRSDIFHKIAVPRRAQACAGQRAAVSRRGR